MGLTLQLLLELGRPEEVLARVATPPPHFTPTAETAHSKALAMLLMRRPDEARELVKQELRSKPNHFGLRLTAAIVDYASTVSTAFPAWSHLSWPIPPPWSFVKRDPESAARRASAAARFRELLALALRQDRNSLRVWELACLANDLDQENAQSLAQSILSDSPDYAPAIVWACERDYEFNRRSSIEKLREGIAKGTTDREKVEALLIALGTSDQFGAAEAILAETKGSFSRWDAICAWRTHKIQCLAALGRVEEASALLADEPDVHRRVALESAVVRSNPRSSQDPRSIAAHLEQAFAVTGEPALLLSCCEAKAQAADWAFIAEHSKRLVVEIRTESALRLAVQGSFNNNNFDLTLSLLDTHDGLCSGGKLAADLRRLRAECLRRLGRVPLAIGELEKLVLEKPNFPNIGRLFSLQQAKGDLIGSAVTARKLLELTDVPASFLLQVAPVVRLRDPALAAKLWEKAVNSIGEDPVLKTQAALQSFALGVESRAVDLLEEIPAMAQSGEAPIKALSIEEMIEFIRESHAGTEKLLELYSKGLVPIHILPGRIRTGLGRLIVETAIRNSAHDYPRLCPPLLIRHGLRAAQMPAAIPAGEKTIYLDVTSVFLCHAIGFLDVIEQIFDEIVVSDHVTAALTLELEQLTHRQPNRLAAQQAVLALLDGGKVKQYHPEVSSITGHRLQDLMGDEWCGILEWVRGNRGLLVDHFPLISNRHPPRPVSLPTEDFKFVCSETALTDAMNVAGLLPDTHLQRGGEKNVLASTPPLLRKGMFVYLEHGVAEDLASKDCLRHLAAHCEVFIGSSEVSGLKRELESDLANRKLMEQIGDLLDRLSRGQNSGKYRTHFRTRPVPETGAEGVSLEELCLYDTIDFGETVGSIVCCDDRFLQAYQSTGRSPLAGLVDLFAHLRTTGLLSEANYYAWILRLRAANARYLPLTDDEILYHLSRAHIQNHMVEETPALRAVRRATASMLLDCDLLQEAAANSSGEWTLREMALPLAFTRTATEALLALWTGTATLEEAEARADWVLNSLFLDFRVLRQCYKSRQGAETDLHSLGLTLGLFYSQGLRFSGPRESRTERRQRFFRWITERLLNPLSAKMPALARIAAGFFADTLRSADQWIQDARSRHGEKSSEEMGIRLLVGELILDLPDKIRAALELPDERFQEYGISVQRSGIEMAGMSFNDDKFWAAVARAAKDGGATLESIDGKGKLRFSRGSTSTTLRILKHGLTEIEMLPLFDKHVDEKARLLRAHPEWFDLNAAEREAAIDRIIRTTQPIVRVKLLEEYQSESMANYYAGLRSAFERKRMISISELVPKSIESLPRFLRLRTGSSETNSIRDSTAADLLRSEGLQETIRRLSCLPTALPMLVEKQFDSQDSATAAALLGELASEMTSFVQRLHLGRLWLRSSSKLEVTERVREFVSYLCDPKRGGAEAAEFSAILRWASMQLGWRPDFCSWPMAVRLATLWSHAGQLQSILPHGTSADMTAWFSDNSQELEADVGVHRSWPRDICHPRNVDPGDLLVRGMGFLFEGTTEAVIMGSGVREALSTTLVSETKIGSLPFLKPVTRYSNGLNSFLAVPRENFLPRLLGPDAIAMCSSLEQFCDLQSAIGRLARDPGDASLWGLVEFLGGSGTFSTGGREILSRTLSTLALAREFTTNAKLPELIMATCQVAAQLGETTVKAKLRSELIALAKLGASPKVELAPSQPIDSTRIGAALIDGAWRLNADSSDSSERVSAFLKDVVALLRSWPALASICSSPVTTAITQLPIECQTEWLPVQLELRALA